MFRMTLKKEQLESGQADRSGEIKGTKKYEVSVKSARGMIKQWEELRKSWKDLEGCGQTSAFTFFRARSKAVVMLIFKVKSRGMGV